MTGERRRSTKGREIRLEGAGLLLATVGLAALLVGAFWAGRWFERRDDGGGFLAASGSLDRGEGFEPQGEVLQDPADLDSDTDLFDRGDGQTAEPGREVRPRPVDRAGERPSRRNDETERAVEVAAPRDGRFWVQVFAGRDEDGAAELVDRLRRSGFPVRVFRERDGRSTLYKVRVGGYPDRAGARGAADRLQSAGYPGAWVTEADDAG